MTYNIEEWPGTSLKINGWSLTGRRVWNTAFEARHECGATTGFDSIPQFMTNVKKCYGCQINRPNMDAALSYHYGIYKGAAAKRKIPFEIDRDRFYSLVLRVCYYCGEVQEIKYRTFIFLVNGIDRIDNTKGYIEGNVRTCCRICNVAKGSMTEEEFLQAISKWHERLIVGNKWEENPPFGETK